MSEENKSLPFSVEDLERVNSKSIENEFFTPDNVYIDLALLKDIPLGVMYAYTLVGEGSDAFTKLQSDVLTVIEGYQSRVYDTIDPYFGGFGWTDNRLEEVLKHREIHDSVFTVAPVTEFFNTLIKHTVRNQNHSGPAEKFVKKRIDKRQFRLEPIPITYTFNTYPLSLSKDLSDAVAKELGESFGVNVKFVNKDPALFDQTDWDTWLSKIDCFYLNSLGRFTESETMLQKQGDFSFAGVFFFARKRFEKTVEAAMKDQDFDQQIGLITARISMMCDFEWLTNTSTRLTETFEASNSEETEASPKT